MLASNVPSGDGWYYAIFGNPIFIAGGKLFLSQAMLPSLTARLSRVKYGVRGAVELRSKLAARLHSTQVPLSKVLPSCVHGIVIIHNLAGCVTTHIRSCNCACGTSCCDPCPRRELVSSPARTLFTPHTLRTLHYPALQRNYYGLTSLWSIASGTGWSSTRI